MAEVLRDRARPRTIGLGTYEDVVVTEDWTPLEPEVIENKWYAPGRRHDRRAPTRPAATGTIELVEYTPAG